MEYHLNTFPITPAFNPSDFDLESFPFDQHHLKPQQEEDWIDFAGFCFSPNSTEAFSAPLDQLTIHSSPKSDPLEISSLGSPLSLGSKKISKQSRLPDFTSEDYELLFGETKPTRNKRRGWSATEDAQLLELIDMHGKKWTEVGKMINGRTGKQVRDRFVNVLMPNIKKKNWTIAEDQLIIDLFAEFGPKWTKIAEHMDGRPEVQVKNRFYTHLKKQYEAQKNSQKTGNNQNSCLEKCLERIEKLTQPNMMSYEMTNQEENSGDFMDMISFVDK